jgi:hypothetical protein
MRRPLGSGHGPERIGYQDLVSQPWRQVNAERNTRPLALSQVGGCGPARLGYRF